MSGKEESGLELARLRAALASNPKSEVFIELARHLCVTGQPEEAEQICRKGLVFNPDSVAGKVTLARALLDRGLLRAAQELLVNVVRASPENGEAMRRLGQLALRRGQKAQARTILEYAEELMPGDGTVAQLLVQADGQPSFGAKGPTSMMNMPHVSGGTPNAGPDMGETIREPWREGVRPLTPLPRGHASSPRRDADRPPPMAGTLMSRAAGMGRLQAEGASQGPRWIVGLGVVAVAILVIVLTSRKQVADTRTKSVVAPAIASGALGDLTRASDQLKSVITQARDMGSPVPQDALVGLAALNATLTVDWGFPLADAHEAVEQARMSLPAVPEAARENPTAEAEPVRGWRRTLAAADALLVLVQGDIDRAHRLVPDPAGDPALPEQRFVSLAAARIQRALGSFELALSLLPKISDSASVSEAILRTRLLLDAGQAEESAETIERLAELAGDDVRVTSLQIELAWARGGAPDPAMEGAYQAACQDASSSPVMQFACALHTSIGLRLGGKHVDARDSAIAMVEHVKTSGTLQCPRDLAQLALLLANLGEVDAADAMVEQAVGAGGVRLGEVRWARLAIALGRMETITGGDFPSAGLLPDARLAKVRGRVHLALPTTGRRGLSFPTGAATLDPDLDAWLALDAAGTAAAQLVGAGLTEAGQETDAARIERRARAGNPVAAFVLARVRARGRGVAARRDELQWLQLALTPHGDQCFAARKLVSLGRGAPASLPALDRIAAANARCQPTLR